MRSSSLSLTLLIAAALGCTGAIAQTPGLAQNAAPPVAVQAPKLEIIDVKVGTGAEAFGGSTVEVHYTGWVYSHLKVNNRGRQFDTSAGRGLFSFQLGVGKVVKGWDQGVLGMRVGGKRTLIIPSELGYGSQGSGAMIPPNATLIFDIELVNVK